MPRKFAVITALTLGAVVSSVGVASASDNNTKVQGGGGFSSSEVVVNAPQQGVLIVNGTLVDGRCIAPWSNGAVLAGVLAPNSHYAACNTAQINQSQNAASKGGLLF
ncbi:hypothetical protein AB0D27_19955 [Streptomyces sp. NPDC048415]|uniref:hypothetical protein n=1 Tax=Streptomyces sp. NPDC048415 TaxID=3154822 RepID=UPI003431EDA7